MSGLTADEQTLCARIFDRLVTGIGSKIAYPTAALATDEVAGSQVSQDTVNKVLQKLTPKKARILKPVNTNGLPGFEIFHDVLGLPILECKRREEELVQAEKRRQQELVQAEEKRRADLAETRKFYIQMLLIGAIACFLMLVLFYREASFQATQAQSERIRLHQAQGLSIWVNFDFKPGSLTNREIDALWKVAEASGDFMAGFVTPLTAPSS
jgi:hypothetical protein